MSAPDAVLSIPRSRIADGLRVAACLVFGLPFLLLGGQQSEMLVLAVFLLGYALSLILKMADPRPAFEADQHGLAIFRWPGASIRYTWPEITEITFRRMRVKHVLFIKADGAVPPCTEIAGFDFKGAGPRVAERLRAIWERHR